MPRYATLYSHDGPRRQLEIYDEFNPFIRTKCYESSEGSLFYVVSEHGKHFNYGNKAFWIVFDQE